MILGQLRIGARQAKNAALNPPKYWICKGFPEQDFETLLLSYLVNLKLWWEKVEIIQIMWRLRGQIG